MNEKKDKKSKDRNSVSKTRKYDRRAIRLLAMVLAM